jgi:hypothetical protein
MMAKTAVEQSSRAVSRGFHKGNSAGRRNWDSDLAKRRGRIERENQIPIIRRALSGISNSSD